MSDTAATHSEHSAHPPGFAHQFETVEQQREAGSLGMWLFLMTEILFFGGMFTAYIVYRLLHFQAFEIGSHLLNYRFGATNTAVLICSSLTMVLAIHSAQTGKSKNTIIFWLVMTMILGAAFIGIKLRFEWYRDYVEHIIPGVAFTNRPEWGSYAPRSADIHVLLFLHDRLARAAHGHRPRHSHGARDHDGKGQVLAGILCAAGY